MGSHPVLTAARELQPLIRQHLEEGERRARLAPEVVSAAGKAGPFRLFAPREVGGLEVSLPDALAVTEVIGAADAAVGWYMINSMRPSLATAYVPEPMRAELFAEPDRNFGNSPLPGGKAIPVAGGYRVSGQWPLVTGCEDALWCGLGGMVMDGDGPRQVNGRPDMRYFFIPTAELDIEPTWQDAAAMRGTGSNAASVREVFVPEALAIGARHPPADRSPRVSPTAVTALFPDRRGDRLRCPGGCAPAGNRKSRGEGVVIHRTDVARPGADSGAGREQ